MRCNFGINLWANWNSNLFFRAVGFYVFLSGKLFIVYFFGPAAVPQISRSAGWEAQAMRATDLQGQTVNVETMY